MSIFTVDNLVECPISNWPTNIAFYYRRLIQGALSIKYNFGDSSLPSLFFSFVHLEKSCSIERFESQVLCTWAEISGDRGTGSWLDRFHNSKLYHSSVWCPNFLLSKFIQIIRLIQLLSAVKPPSEQLLWTGWKADPAPATDQKQLRAWYFLFCYNLV